MEYMKKELGTYAIFEEAAFDKKNACVLVESGKFYGMGLIPDNLNFTQPAYLKPHLTQYPENEVIKSMIRSYAQKHPSRVLVMD